MGQTVNLLAHAYGGSNPSLPTFFMRRRRLAEVAQLVEHQPSKLRVAGSNLVFRSSVSTLSPSGDSEDRVGRFCEYVMLQ